MKKIIGIIIFMLMIAIIVPATSENENWTQVQRLMASDFEMIGCSLSIDGDTLVTGATNDGNLEGSAYVFIKNGSTWTEQAKLVPSDGFSTKMFGSPISLYGDTVLIGNSWGEVYEFSRSGTTWTEQYIITPPDSDIGYHTDFGRGISLSGDTAIIGDTNGCAYIFIHTGTIWTLQARLSVTDRTEGDEFGHPVFLSGNTALVGASGDDSNTGSVYVFTRTGTTWTQQTKLIAADGKEGDCFGYSVSIDGDTALIGAPSNNSEKGAAYLFNRNGNTWTQQHKFTISENEEWNLGCSIALNNDTAIIGAYGEHEGVTKNSVSAYIYTLTNNTWIQQKLLGSDGKEWYMRSWLFTQVYLDMDTAVIIPTNLGIEGAFMFTKGGIQQNIAPTAGFTWTPTNPKINQTITFDASTSSDKDGSITLYEWDWNNDGTFDESQTTETASNSWTKAGNYAVKLRVTDNNGATNNKTKAFTIVSDSEDQTPDTSTKTPGFEIVLFICAIAISILLWKKKRNT